MEKCFCHFNGYAVKDATARKDLATARTDIDTTMSELASEKENRLNGDTELNNAIAVERERIDNFTSLPEGSTTGDAELMDGRIDYTGNSWNNIGSHIRGVSNIFDEKINNLESNFPKEYKKENTTIENGVWNNQHEIKIIESGEYLHLTEVIVKGGDILKVTCWGNTWFSPFYIFDANYNLLDSYHTISGDTSESDVHVVDYEVTMPEGAKYFCGNA